ncbi:MAG: hypothetical protein ACRDDW_04925 [Candidatus Rhabdochlamydia sp.]
MNKILKIITAYFVLPASFLCAGSQEVQDEKQNDCGFVENSFGYLNIGVGSLPELAPSFGLGYRAQKDHHGFDVSGSIANSCKEATARLNVLYNYFFKPNPEAQLFAGVGLGAKGVHAHEKSGFDVAAYPVLAVGQEFKTKADSQRIVQVQVGWPAWNCVNLDKEIKANGKSSYHATYPGFNKKEISYVPEVIVSYGFGF